MTNNVIQLPTREVRSCESCGEGSVRMARELQTFAYGSGEHAVQLTAEVPVWTCDTCGDQYTDGDAEEIRHAAVCAHLGRLTPTEIKQIRECYQLSQAEFADLTGFGDASVKRWESGSLIQNAAADRYLRLVRERKVFAALQSIVNARDEAGQRKKVFRTELAPELTIHASYFRLRA